MPFKLRPPWRASACRRCQLAVLLQLLLILIPCASAQESTTPTPSSSFASRCRALESGARVFSDGKLVEYASGEVPLILAAPHGGKKKTVDFPKRGKSDGVIVSDWNTDRLARAIASELGDHGGTPHLVICHLHRGFMDANRPLDAACASDSPAKAVWHAYQDAILAAKQAIVAKHGRGLFVELHGHGHAEPRLELGYLLRARDYEYPRNEFLKLNVKSSLREIAERGQCDVDELLRGDMSLGAFLAKQGIQSMPSPQFPHPGELPYFNGGWNTVTHGSRDSGTISSLQIECHLRGLRDSDDAIRDSAKKIASALHEFLQTHYARTDNKP